ncbi:Mu transposase C-terminal domain-containing protein [Methylocystis sp. MJC1]|nr:Mu transposase C-terminal domain-containing protein [Methylocystis sp. MJC1]
MAIVLSRTPSPKSALKALKLAMSDKTRVAKAYGASADWAARGLPVLIAADNGSSFIDADFRETVARLGITILYTPAGLPQLRATIERIFRTLTLEAIAPYTGRTFENPVRRGDYPAEARATLTFEELAQALTLAVVDIYHNKPHSGLGGETPLNAWRRLVDKYGAPPPPDRLTMIVEFGISAQAKTGVEGIRHANFWYHSDDLQRHRLQRGDGYVEIHFDPDLISAIAVKLEEEWILVPAVDQVLSNVSLMEWERESAYLRKLFASQAEVSRPAVRHAVEKLRAIDQLAVTRAGITPQLISDGALRAAAENTMINFAIVDVADGVEAGESTSAGFLSNQIPTGEPERPVDQSTTSDNSQPAKRSRSWRIED